MISYIAKIICLLFSVQLSADTVMRVGLPVPGHVPFMWTDQQGDVVGIYADTIRKVARDIGVHLEFIPLSQARLIKHFMAGEVDIEMGVSEQDIELPAMRELSTFSYPFGFVNEVVIYNQDLRFSTFLLKDLEDQKVAVVRGRVIPEYLDRQDFASPLQIAKRVDRGWSQLGLMYEATAIHYKFNQGMKYKISLPYQSKSVSIRLHKKHNALMNKINKSINRLKQEGYIENIICDYLCGD